MVAKRSPAKSSRHVPSSAPRRQGQLPLDLWSVSTSSAEAVGSTGAELPPVRSGAPGIGSTPVACSTAVVRTVTARVTRATVHPTPRRRLVLAELDAPQRPTMSIENVPAAARPAAVALEVLGTAFVFAAFLTAVLYL